jgi:hypothetical protein
VFAKAYSNDVAGMVFVDATHEDTILLLNNKRVRMREQAKDRAVPEPRSGITNQPTSLATADTDRSESLPQPAGTAKIEPPFTRLPSTAQALRLWFMTHRVSVSTGYLAEELRDLYEARQNKPQELGDIPLISLTGTKSCLTESARKRRTLPRCQRMDGSSRLPTPAIICSLMRPKPS